MSLLNTSHWSYKEQIPNSRIALSPADKTQVNLRGCSPVAGMVAYMHLTRQGGEKELP